MGNGTSGSGGGGGPSAATSAVHKSAVNENCRSLYVGGLSEKVVEGLLYEIFSIMGPVESCKICKDKVSGQSSGYGFVDYYDHRTAAMALEQFTGRRIYGEELKVNWALNSGGSKEDTSNHYHIFVGDLSPEIDDKALYNAFAVFGNISDARVMWDLQRPGHSRGYGFVAFRTKESAQRALTEMNGEWLGTRAIRCNWANQKGQSGIDPSDYAPTMDFNQVLAQTPANNTTVYVGNIAPDTTLQLMQQCFGEYGPIDEVKVQGDKGFAFVRYTTHESAAKAICGMHGKMIGTRTVKCSWGKDRIITAPPVMSVPPPGMLGYPAAPPMDAMMGGTMRRW